MFCRHSTNRIKVHRFRVQRFRVHRFGGQKTEDRGQKKSPRLERSFIGLDGWLKSITKQENWRSEIQIPNSKI
jgi:hypothetical protein